MKLRHNNGNTSKSVLGIYAFPAIKNINPNQGSTKDYTHPSGQSRGPNGDGVDAEVMVMMAMVMVAKRIIIGITVESLSNHCPNYIRNHW